MQKSIRSLTVLSLTIAVFSSSLFANAVLVEAHDASKVKYVGSWQTRTVDTDDQKDNIPFSRFPQVHGGKVQRSETPGDKAIFEFSGTSVSVIFLTSMAGGVVQASIDGQDRGSFSLYNNAYQSPPAWQMYFGACYYEIVIANDLSDGPHTLELTVANHKQFNWHASGHRVDINAFRYGSFPFATITGKVIDADGDAVHREVDWKIPNPRPVVIELKGPQSYRVFLSDDGTYTLSGIREGTYDVVFSGPGFKSQTRSGVELKAGKETAVDFQVGIGAGHPLQNKVHAPRAGTPILALPGHSFEITVNAGENAANWTAHLRTPYNRYPLTISQAAFDEVRGWTLNAEIAADIPAELYDLVVLWRDGAGLSDTSVRAVKVYQQFKNEFYFVHHTDPQGNINDFKTVTAELNIINPEFVITTGDNIPGPWRPGKNEWDWKKWTDFIAVLNDHQVPTLSAPGNHCVGPGMVLMEYYYKQFVGRRYWSQRYGDYHILTLDNNIFNLCNAYKFDRGGYWTAREAWAVDQLKVNSDAKMTFLGVHVGMDSFTDLPGNSWYQAMKQLGTTNGCWIDDYGIDMVVHGHWGKDTVSRVGAKPTIYAETRDIGGEKAYRLVRVKDDKIVSHTYEGHPTRSLSAGNLTLTYAAENNGSAARNTATISNKHNERFEQAQVKFIMKKGNYKVEAQPGAARIWQTVNSDDGRFTICYVECDLPARSENTITISPAQ